MSYARLTFGISLSFAIIISGCAIQKDRSGALKFEVDEAAILGNTLQTFRLPDGSEARLREANGRISLKLQKQMTVIPIDNAVLAEARSVASVGGRTLIIVTKAMQGCTYTTQLIAIQGREVLTWDIGDCTHAPTMQVVGDTAFFDHRQDNGSILRFVYQNGRIGRTNISSQTQQSNTQPVAPVSDPANAIVPLGAPRYRPSLPVEVSRSESPASTEAVPRSNTASSATARPVASTRPSSPSPAKALEFPTQELKPIRIILDK
jgi:hypothetical protein